MSLPMLVNGAECGPSNPLQGLSKRFDQDRGIQQDQFSSARAGSSKETFRSHYSAAPGVNQDAARFFSGATPALQAQNAFDLSALHHTLPISHAPAVQAQSPSALKTDAAAWAADFLQQMPGPSALASPVGKMAQQQGAQRTIEHATTTGSNAGFYPGMMYPSMAMGTSQFAPMDRLQAGISQAQPQIDATQWDQVFRSQEDVLSSAPNEVLEASASEQPSRARTHDPDELARTAGLLLDSVQNETSAKFQNSAFMGLMRQLRDGHVVVEGNEMVERAAAGVDMKGKGRAVEVPNLARPIIARPLDRMGAQKPNADPDTKTEDTAAPRVWDDANDAYFRQENEEYIAMEAERERERAQGHQVRFAPQQEEWDSLQRDWDAFEATAHGLRSLGGYAFQANNPYLSGDAARTRHHAAHADAPQSLYESVLEVEAAVQREPQNAARWYELGVKQQENEREQQAVQALRRALALDPALLGAWLALAVSHTNEGDRVGACDAIREWVERNPRYAPAVARFRAQHPEMGMGEGEGGGEGRGVRTSERLARLMECLMSIVRDDAGLGEGAGEIDADIQIALAVLLNTNEDYARARDCFTTALAVRPNDWLLYNRVGATLANSGHPEEALQYYYAALELNPGYIRARFNLGISCTNLRRYEEAAQHMLDALSLQDGDGDGSGSGAGGGADAGRGVTSSALWDSLKTCCLHLHRLDLATLCDKRDLEAFRLNFQMEM